MPFGGFVGIAKVSGHYFNNNTKSGDLHMSQEDNIPKTERIPFFQRMLDNPFLLLFIGVAMPTVFYVLWGVMEIATIPVAE